MAPIAPHMSTSLSRNITCPHWSLQYCLSADVPAGRRAAGGWPAAYIPTTHHRSHGLVSQAASCDPRQLDNPTWFQAQSRQRGQNVHHPDDTERVWITTLWGARKRDASPTFLSGERV